MHTHAMYIYGGSQLIDLDAHLRLRLLGMLQSFIEESSLKVIGFFQYNHTRIQWVYIIYIY